MKKILCPLAVLLVCLAAAGRDVTDFTDGWEFSRDRSIWRAVDIPHDWAIEGPFDPNGDPHTGKLPWKGVGWYRRQMVVPSAPAARRIFLDFDGVMCDGTVFVNGQPCAHQPYGYLGMRADITPYLFAGTNEVVVKADTTRLASRWYPGAGMYRRVRKIETGDIYVDESDVFVSPAEKGGGAWSVAVTGAVTSRRPAPAAVRAEVSLKAPDGSVIARGAADLEDAAMYAKTGFAVTLDVRDPLLWDMKPDAALYTAVISVAAGDGAPLDEISVRTGLRTFRFDPDDGFHLNGRRVQLKGVCLHSDLGILGMAFNRSAMLRQLKAMVDMGVNALRTSHNPPSPELLDMCDEMGIFVWDECFDKWNVTCGRGDEPLEDFVPARLAEFVRRDRNHPCVFVWSIGNEISPGRACPPGQEHWEAAGLPSLGTSAERCARFRGAVRALDATRPVGIGSCFPEVALKGDYAPLDITGWNYRGMYDKMKARYPDKPVLYSESASALSEYGHYAAKLPAHKEDYDAEGLGVDSYDRNAARWSDIPDIEFERMERDRFVGGEFVWTGADYLGEPTPFAASPVNGRAVAHADLARSAYFGIYDLLCMPKDRAYLYRSHWRKDAFTLHIAPDHWTFPEKAGATMPVYVYTSADEAELFLNGVSLGRRRKDASASSKTGYYDVLPRYRLVWNDVRYAPGELKAVAYGAGGEVLGEKVLRTAGEAARVVLAPEADAVPPDPNEYLFVAVSLEDAAGVAVSRDSRRVSFSVDGPARIVSVGNADPRGLDSFKDVSSHPLHNGRAGLYLRRTGPGEVSLTASADGLASAVFRDRP